MNSATDHPLSGHPRRHGPAPSPPGVPAFGELWAAAEGEHRCQRHRRYLVSAAGVVAAAITITYLAARTPAPFEESMDGILVALDHGGSSPLGRWESESDRWFAPEPAFSLFE